MNVFYTKKDLLNLYKTTELKEELFEVDALAARDMLFENVKYEP